MISKFTDRIRRAFPLFVCAAASLAVTGGIQASPPRDIPAYALDSAVLYKCEVALALFLGLYLLVTAIALAIEGRTLGKISTTGFELPSDLSASARSQQETIARQERLRQFLDERDQRLSRDIDLLWKEIDRIRPRGAHSER
jgi:hypothetical protein